MMTNIYQYVSFDQKTTKPKEKKKKDIYLYSFFAKIIFVSIFRRGILFVGGKCVMVLRVCYYTTTYAKQRKLRCFENYYHPRQRDQKERMHDPTSTYKKLPALMISAGRVCDSGQRRRGSEWFFFSHNECMLYKRLHSSSSFRCIVSAAATNNNYDNP